MARQGLTRADIIEAAIEMIESEGLHSFSLRELAGRLHIKAASLYNHIKSSDELHTEIGFYAISELKRAQLAAIAGKERAEAVESLADAYYRFGKERPELYKVILSLPMVRNDAIHSAGFDIVDPIMTAMAGYHLTGEQMMHLQRAFRSIMHGFISLEEAGCFRQFPVDVGDSYRMAVRGFILLLEDSEKEARA